MESGLEVGVEVHHSPSAEDTARAKECKPDGARLAEGPREAGCAVQPLLQAGEWQGIRLVNERPHQF